MLEFTKFLLIFCLFFLLPGSVLLLVSGRFRGVSLLAIFSFGFLCSLFLFCILTLSGILLNCPQIFMINVSFAILCATIVGIGYLGYRIRHFNWKSYFIRLTRKIRPEDYAFLLITFFVFVTVLRQGAFLNFGDVWIHIAYVTKFVFSAKMTPAYPFFRDDPPDINYGYCPVHPLFALLTLTTGKSVLWCWYYLPALLILVILAVNYYFARLLTQSRFVALLSILILIYCLGFIGSPLLGFGTTPYPRNIVLLIVCPLLWLVILQTIKSFSRLNVLLFILGFSLLIIVHRLTAVHFIITYIVFALITALSRGGTSAVWNRRLALLLLYMLLPLCLYWLLVPSEPISNPVHLTFRENEILRVGKTPLYLASLNIFLFQAGIITGHSPLTPLPIFAYVLLPALFLSPRRNSLGKFYLFANGILLPLTIFNPLLFPLMHKVLTLEGSVRLIQMVPYHIILPYCFYLIIQRTLTETYQTLRRRRNRYYIAGALALLTAVLLMVYLFPADAKREKLFKTETDLYSLNPLFELAAFINQHLPVADEILIADFLSGYIISAITNVAIVGLPETMSSPNHPFILSRNLIIYRYFADISAEDRLRLAAMNKITLVLLNFREINLNFARKLLAEFNANPSVYQPLKKIDDVWLYRINYTGKKP